MRRLILAAAMAAMMPVGAAEAQSSGGVVLSADDAKFHTPRCRAARQRRDRYAAKTGKSRFFVQTAWFLALGSWVPPGTYDPTSEEQAIARDLQKSCVSKPRR